MEISGASAGPGVDGLVITGPSCFVVGLVIRNFQATFGGGGGNGDRFTGRRRQRPDRQSNRHRRRRDGRHGQRWQRHGDLDSPNNRVGPGTAGESPQSDLRQRRKRDPNHGRLALQRSSGQFIGTNLSGTAALGNVGGRCGRPGGQRQRHPIDQPAAGHLRKRLNGITVAGTATSTSIAGNRIGADVDGQSPISATGPTASRFPGRRSTRSAPGNLISGNGLTASC